VIKKFSQALMSLSLIHQRLLNQSSKSSNAKD